MLLTQKGIVISRVLPSNKDNHDKNPYFKKLTSLIRKFQNLKLEVFENTVL